MARYAPSQNTFRSGELSPSLEARDDLLQYKEGCRKCQNFVVQPQGGLIRRSGTHFVAEVADSNDNVRLIPFRVSPTLAYVIEATDLLFRYYTNEGLLISGTPVNDATPYLESELEDLMWAQITNDLYIAHPDHYVTRLRRASATNFTLVKFPYAQGGARMPMYPANLDETFTITITGAGPYTLTASDDLFTDTATDAGRVFRINDTTLTPATYDANDAWFEIISVASSTVATAGILLSPAPAGSVATPNWSRGAQSDTEGFRAIAFHENRLWLLGAADEPEGIWGSNSGIFTRFDEGGADDQAIFLRATGSEVNTVQWAASARGALIVGTAGSEGKVISTDDGGILTNSSAKWLPISNVGSVHTMPYVVNDDVIFAQRDRSRIRRMRSTLEEDNIAEDLSVLHDRALRPGLGHGGIRHMAYQQSPDGVLWCVRNTDGQLAGLSLEKQQEVVAWHRQVIGGVVNVAGDAAQVVSAAVIPNPAGTEDQLWLCVERLIDGASVKYVEFVEDKYVPLVEVDDDGTPTVESLTLAVEEAWFLDSALDINLPLAITNITEADPAVVTSASHGLSNGDQIRISEVVGLLDSDGLSRVNFREFLVANVAMNTFELTDLAGNDIDLSTNATDYISGGVARETFTVVTGLDHLEGETVRILANGAPHPDEIVSAGQITLDYETARVVVGLPYTSLAETQRFHGGNPAGTDASRSARVPRVGLRVDNSVACELAVGPVQEEAWQALSFREFVTWFMNTPPPLYSGDKDEAVNGAWERGRTIKFRTNTPLPLTVLALYPHMESHDR